MGGRTGTFFMVPDSKKFQVPTRKRLCRFLIVSSKTSIFSKRVIIKHAIGMYSLSIINRLDEAFTRPCPLGSRGICYPRNIFKILVIMR